ncbi:EAL domain-containing protein [Vibrio aquaticus]|uniref:EAL domain-containing protein n=1 Tax=Vibrio aquaticus TaxID=2496559 RepID=A0A3S0P820_9VIBR|nr:EAL domain-containing protein [Vibrio aquaticus]RTZ17366.1 EAL domain-containing protein [Vibrio aquaticus]
MILSTKQQFVDCLFMNEQSQFCATYKELTLTSVFQPIFDLRGQPIGVEALVRIQHEIDGAIRPDLFFHSDEVGFEDKLNVERLSRVIHIRNFARSKLRHLHLFLNVLPSAGEYLALENIDSSLLSKRLKALEIDNSQIVMEVVELAAENEESLALAMEKLNECKFNIAVDDFGVNASNRKRAEAIKPHIIKIDRSLMLAYVAGDQFPLLSGLKVARSLNAKVVVEGIETIEQLSAMQALNIDYYQGYYLAMPEALEAVYLSESNNIKSLGDPSQVYKHLSLS